MNTSKAFTLGAMSGASMMTTVIIGLVMYVLLVIAFWKMFEKLGEPGWKAIIPLYNSYILYKYTWKRNMFWVSLVLNVLGSILLTIGAGNGTAATINQPMLWIGVVVLLAECVIAFIAAYKVSVAFEHGIGYFFGLIILPNIFYLILGFGKSRYVGTPDTPKVSG